MAFLSDLLGSKPRVPTAPSVDPDQVQLDTIAGNLAALPQAQNLAGQVNTFNQGQLQQMYAAALPGYENIRSQVGKNILAQVRGELGDDFIAQDSGRTAAQALYGGFGGSQAGRHLTERDLNINRLARQESGMNAAQRWLQTGTVPQYDITSTFFSPGARLQNERENENAAFDVKWMKRQISAMPEPWGQQLMSDLGAASSIAGMYAGGGGGGSSGGGGGGES